MGTARSYSRKDKKRENPVKVRTRVFIMGRVQGVFFRSGIALIAKRHGVTGWVRNLEDGRVEAVFEGEQKAVNELLEFCGRGPQGAKVTNVSIVKETCRGEFEDFEIREGSRF